MASASESSWLVPPSNVLENLLVIMFSKLLVRGFFEFVSESTQNAVLHTNLPVPYLHMCMCACECTCGGAWHSYRLVSVNVHAYTEAARILCHLLDLQNVQVGADHGGRVAVLRLLEPARRRHAAWRAWHRHFVVCARRCDSRVSVGV